MIENKRRMGGLTPAPKPLTLPSLGLAIKKIKNTRKLKLKKTHYLIIFLTDKR